MPTRARPRTEDGATTAPPLREPGIEERPVIVPASFLEELRSELREIRAELRGLRRDPKRRRLAREHLLPVLTTAVAGYAFTTAEVFRHAKTDETLSTALDAAEIANAQSLGKYLRSIKGRTIGGVRIEQIGDEAEGLVWRAEYQP
jgi:hypothetical protein